MENQQEHPRFNPSAAMTLGKALDAVHTIQARVAPVHDLVMEVRVNSGDSIDASLYLALNDGSLIILYSVHLKKVQPHEDITARLQCMNAIADCFTN